MSERLKVPDVLDRKQGGSAPLFHALLQLKWAALGEYQSLVVDSVDPQEQIDANQLAIPKVQPHVVFADSTEHREPVSGEKLGEVSAEVLLASWVHKSTVHGSKAEERQFLLRVVQRQELPPSADRANHSTATILTDYLVGQNSTQVTRVEEVDDAMISHEMSRGISDEEADVLAGYMDDPRHQSRVESRMKLRAESEAKARVTVASFPKWDALKADGKADSVGKVSYNGKTIDGLAQQALNSFRVQEQLTKSPPTSLLHDKIVVGTNVIALMGAQSGANLSQQ